MQPCISGLSPQQILLEGFPEPQSLRNVPEPLLSPWGRGGHAEPRVNDQVGGDPGSRTGRENVLSTQYSLSVFEISFTLYTSYRFEVLFKMEKWKNMNIWRAETVGESPVRLEGGAGAFIPAGAQKGGRDDLRESPSEIFSCYVHVIRSRHRG